jgi:hypothetical protein
MDDPERPPFRRIILDHIDMILYKVDQYHWPLLTGLRVPHKLPAGKPRKPPMAGVLLNQLEWYASVLFTREVEQYGHYRRDPRYSMWLSKLGDRIVTRVLNAVEEIDKADENASLQYHGLSREDAETGVRKICSDLAKKYVWEASDEFLKLKAQAEAAASQTTVPPAITPTDPSVPFKSAQSSERRALLTAYRDEFPDVKIQDICWAAYQTYREWKRWISGKAKGGLKPDRTFRRILTCGKPPEEIRRQPRPTKYNQ